MLSLSRTKQLNKFNKDDTGSSGVKFLISGPLKPTNLQCENAIPSVVSGKDNYLGDPYFMEDFDATGEEGLEVLTVGKYSTGCRSEASWQVMEGGDKLL